MSSLGSAEGIFTESTPSNRAAASWPKAQSSSESLGRPPSPCTSTQHKKLVENFTLRDSARKAAHLLLVLKRTTCGFLRTRRKSSKTALDSRARVREAHADGLHVLAEES